MAQKTIALGIKITSEGQEKVISNLQDLENELTTLQNKLKTLDFGSAAFKETTANIQKLKTKIDDIDKSTEGLGAEKRFNAINASVGILVSSLQILSGIMGVVIADAGTLEQVQRAEATAVGILNAALGILQIRREIEDQQITALKIKEAALAGITKIATAAQAAYNAVLAANPIGLVVAGVVALTGALYLLFRATSDEVAAEEELNKQLEIQTKLNQELAIETKKAAQESKIGLTILTDNVKQRNLELKTIEDLKKAYPGFNAFLDRNNQLTAQGIEFLKIQIALEEAQAKLKFLRNRQTDLEIKAQTDLNEELENQNTFFGSLFTKLKGGLNPIGQYTAKANALTDAIADESRELKVVNSSISEQEQVVDDLLGKIAPLNKKLEQQAKAEEKAGKETAKTTEIVDKSLLAIEKRTQAISMIVEELKRLQAADLQYTSQIIQKGEEVLQEQSTFLESRTQKLKTQSEKLLDEIAEYFFKTIPSEAELKILSDGYKDLFDSIFTAFRSGELDFKKTTGWDEFVKFAETKLPDIGKSLANVNEQSKQSFIEYFNSLDDRVSKINTLIQGEFLNFFPQAATMDTLKVLLDVENQIAKLRTDRIKLGLTEEDLQNKSRDIIREQLGLNKRLIELAKENGQDTYNYQLLLQKGDNEAAARLKTRIEARNKEAETLNATADAILEGVINTDSFVKGFIEVNKQAEKNYQQILKNKQLIEGTFKPENFAGIEQFFKENAQDYFTILFDIFNNQQEYFEKFGEDGIKAIFSGLQIGLQEIDGLGREELQDLYNNLKLLGDQFAEIFGIADNPFIKLLDEISKRLKKLPTEAQESFTKTIEGIKEVADVVLQVFNEILGQMNTLISAQNSLLLEQLQYKQETALAIIGEANTESEKENKKIEARRLEVQKKFAKERFEIEKKARVQELQFALANALATGANAVLNALALQAPPPIPILYAGVIGGLTIAQAAIIRDQIQFTQSKAFVGRRGGIIMGESHEGANGGVPALLEGGEFVVNKEGVRQFGDIISSINNSTGGRALTIDDSRIVQAIASQNMDNKQPLKAYVLYNDIQDTTKLNQKITQLARL